MNQTRLSITSRLLACILVGGSIAAATASLNAYAVSGSAYTNPVYAWDFPDPFVLNVGRIYYAYGTESNGKNIPVLQSEDMINWRLLPDALPVLPAWASPGHNWAPSVLQRGDVFVMYYSVRDTASKQQCISRATSPTPAGPFTDGSTAPLVCQVLLGGSIDPAPFVDRDGMVYLTWKADTWYGVATLWSQPLSADGLTLEGEPVQLLKADEPWESNIIEAPFMVLQDERYFLFFSGNRWDTAAYATGYAVCASANGPCVSSSRNPVMAARGTVTGPGGASFFTDARGVFHVAYHAWAVGRVGYSAGGRRTLRVDDVTFTSGMPALHGPTERATSLGGLVMDHWRGAYAHVGVALHRMRSAYWQGWNITRVLTYLPAVGGPNVLDGWKNVQRHGVATQARAAYARVSSTGTAVSTTRSSPRSTRTSIGLPIVAATITR